MKKKKCTHGAKLYSIQDGCMKCQFCGALLKDNDFKKHKTVKPIEKKTTKKRNHFVDVNKKIKIGYEQQNPNIAKAETMKRNYAELSLHIKREIDPEAKKQLQQKQRELKAKMLRLQDELQSMD